MWHIIIQTSEGRIYHAASDNKPTTTDVNYWEDYWTDKGDYKHQAVVTNIYETED